ncbi:MAG: CopG family ribbon-helix-helix protein [Gemmatimonadales bacterium]
MGKAKIAVTLDTETVRRLDHLVRQRRYKSRSRAVQEAVEEKLSRLERRRLAEECAKLDPVAERKFAEEGLAAQASEWPEY